MPLTGKDRKLMPQSRLRKQRLNKRTSVSFGGSFFSGLIPGSVTQQKEDSTIAMQRLSKL